MYAMRGMQDADDLVRRVYRAIRHKQPLTLTYLEIKKDRDGKPVYARKGETQQYDMIVRTVEPWKVELSADRNVYMRTYDRGNGEVRSYRLDRILFYSVHRSQRLVPNEYEEVAV